jgi:hypothetical protein
VTCINAVIKVDIEPTEVNVDSKSTNEVLNLTADSCFGRGTANWISVPAGIWYVQKPWHSGGSFDWPIPGNWRIGGAGTTNSLTGWDQRFELQSNGTVTIRKWGKWVTRSTNDVITTN